MTHFTQARYHGICWSCSAGIIPGDSIARERRAATSGRAGRAVWVTLCRACGRRAAARDLEGKESRRAAYGMARAGGDVGPQGDG